MILVKMHQLISGTILLLLFLIGNLSYAQEPRGRVSEEEINTQKVFIDGRIYFDRDENEKTKKMLTKERNRLIQAMIRVKKGGSPTQKAERVTEKEYHCDTID